ncbi:hypothetical protein BTA51_03555 [Hahella sp. CCB-MM4]|uniref:DUF2846 domain-containing protein n=1 Tax=Hahella sp. (strain CCB-MM4) TaxID=1926491 RepID=UPI000B9BA256|nr:DUF2846 domain-containing protein [Hahella sp. CCB-MM4]OZG75461.1 hypothetical protein BTA51_03555 [Hahella sp. CCB-MM4]
MSLVRFLIVILLSLSTVACGYHRYFNGFDDIPEGSASLYIIRPNSFVNMGITMQIFVDEKEIGILKNGHFLDTSINPGAHKIVARTTDIMGDESSLTISAKPNERVYLIASFGLERYFGIKQVGHQEALQELMEFTDK